MTGKSLLVSLCFVLAFVPFFGNFTVHADGFLLPEATGSATLSVSEPTQRAIIAWNGMDEVLILSVDTQASENSHALWVVPFPSNPIVRNASFDSFDAVQHLMDLYVAYQARRYEEEVFPWWNRPPEWRIFPIWWSVEGFPSIRIGYHGKIGSHDITIVHTDNSSALALWIDAISAAHGVGPTTSLETYARILEECVKNGLSYFSLDFIELKANQTSVEPLFYKFATNAIYFPLKTSSLNPGRIELNLFLFTSTYIDRQLCSPFQVAQIQLTVSGNVYSEVGGLIESKVEPLYFPIPKSALNNVDPTISEMFLGDPWFTALEWRGDSGELTQDLSIDRWSVVVSCLFHNAQLILPSILFEGSVLLVLLGFFWCSRRGPQERGIVVTYPWSHVWKSTWTEDRLLKNLGKMDSEPDSVVIPNVD